MGSADETWEEEEGPDTQSVRDPGARLFGICFCLSLLYHLSTIQINPFRPSPSESATENQSFRFSLKIFRLSALAGGPEKFFYRVPNQLSAAPTVVIYAPHWGP